MEEHCWSGIRCPAHTPRLGWRKPSPPSPVGPGGRNPHPACRSNWLILDRFVHRSSRDAEDEEDVTASETSYTCTDRPIRASLRVADSPAVSRLYLHWPGRREFPGMPEPYVIAAHRHSILFNALVPLEDDKSCNDFCFFPDDFFVYSAFSSPPSLHRLPACLTGGISRPEEDKFFKPYWRRQQRTMVESQMGILCHGDNGEFTVADLTEFNIPEAELCLLHHRAPASVSGIETEWRFRKVRFPEPLPPEVYYWRTDAVVPVHDRFLCWVDYYQGMLIVDILLANDKSSPDQQFRYIPLPEEALRSRRQYPEGDCHDPSRCVCVNLAGMLKLVCITNVVASRVHSASCPAFRVTSWTLYDFYQGKWLKDGTMESADFWGLYRGKILPRVRPSYPLVSLVNPDAIVFLLEEDRDIFWMIEVNIKEKVLNSSALYINDEEEEETEEEKEEGRPTKIAPRNMFSGHSFVPCQFSTYLSKDSIRSRELSEMMQKAKELRLMQKKSQLEKTDAKKDPTVEANQTKKKKKQRVKASKAVECRA